MWPPIAILWRVYREYILNTMDPQILRNDVESSYHALQRLTWKVDQCRSHPSPVSLVSILLSCVRLSVEGTDWGQGMKTFCRTRL